MAIKDSALPAAGTLDGTEVVAASQVVSGTLTSVKTTAAAIAALAVRGPATAVADGHLTVFDGTTGKLIKDGGAVPASLTNPMTAVGDLIVGGTAGAPTRLVKGADGTFFGVVGGVAGYYTVAGGGGGITAMNEQTGTSYTLVLADATKGVRCTNAAAIALTIPPNSSVAIPVLSGIPAFQGGAGVITVTAGAGVTLESPNGVVTSAVGDFRTMFQRAANVWVIG